MEQCYQFSTALIHPKCFTGSFGEAFALHEKVFSAEMEIVRIWRSALAKITNLSRWDSRNRDEDALIDEIMIYVLNKLSFISSNRSKGLVGINFHLREMESLLYVGLDDVRMIGIWGMAGIG